VPAPNNEAFAGIEPDLATGTLRELQESFMAIIYGATSTGSERKHEKLLPGIKQVTIRKNSI
jgi:hypothetical protein